LVFSEVFDADVGEIFRGVLNEVPEDGLVVVANDEDFLDLGDFGNCCKAVLDYRVASNRE
jgi:hypothetical protein